MNINQRRYIISASLSFMLGMLITFIIFKYETNELKSVINMHIESVKNSRSFDARMNLHIAQSIRNDKAEDAMHLLENNIRRNVESFTDDGRGFKYLTKDELDVYNAVKEYWEIDCDKQCLNDIEYIFNDKYGHQLKANN